MESFIGKGTAMPVLNQSIYHFDNNCMALGEYKITGVKYECGSDYKGLATLVVTNKRKDIREIPYGSLGECLHGGIMRLVHDE